MIKTLRKRHLLIWSLWALLLPAGIAGALIVRRAPVVTKGFGLSEHAPFPLLLDSTMLDGSLVELRSDGKRSQLRWVNREDLRTASATIYLANSDTVSIERSIYIGRIESRGVYAFDLPVRDGYHFFLYDFIKQVVIARFNLGFKTQTQSSIQKR